jgi:PAS domain S-box-containing protein
MDSEGKVMDVNRSFTKNFGYEKDEITGLNFSMLFILEDKKDNKPLVELTTVLTKGQAHDESFVVDKDGKAIWCTGESILINAPGEEMFIVKDIVNLQARKQLNLFLKNTDELLEHIFETSKDVPMMILDGSMKVEKVNLPFLRLFEISQMPPYGSRLADIQHPFWINEQIKNELRMILVNDEPIKGKVFTFLNTSGEQRRIRIDSKILNRGGTLGRQVFLVLEDLID